MSQSEDYKKRLKDSLSPFSIEKEELFLLLEEWQDTNCVMDMQDYDEKDDIRKCACNQPRIRFRHQIHNQLTNEDAFVGSTCIKHFLKEKRPDLNENELNQMIKLREEKATHYESVRIVTETVNAIVSIGLINEGVGKDAINKTEKDEGLKVFQLVHIARACEKIGEISRVKWFSLGNLSKIDKKTKKQFKKGETYKEQLLSLKLKDYKLIESALKQSQKDAYKTGNPHLFK